MTMKTFNANGKEINVKDVNFINIIYIDEHLMDVTVHTVDNIERFLSKDEALFEELDKYCDISSEK